MKEHLGVVGDPAYLGDLVVFFGPICMFEGFGRVVWTYFGF